MYTNPIMKVVAHAGGKAHGRENDIQTIRRALRDKPDIVEVDVRKSRDGVLYCHHGSIPIGVSAAQFFRFLTFAEIQKLVGKRDTLEDIVRVVPESTILLLDIKDANIDGYDLKKVLADRPQVWIAASSLRRTHKLREVFGEDVVYVLYQMFFYVRHMLPMTLGLTSSFEYMVDGKREKMRAHHGLSETKH